MRIKDMCYEPVAYSYYTGVVVCCLPKGHEGECDGGEAERKVGEHFAVQMIEDRLANEEMWA